MKKKSIRQLFLILMVFIEIGFVSCSDVGRYGEYNNKVTCIKKNTLLFASESLSVQPLFDADVDKTIQEVSPCITKIHCKGYAGSGIIIKVTDKKVIIVTNQHVIAEDYEYQIDFYQGFSVKGTLLAAYGEHDVAFIEVLMDQIPEGVLNKIRYIDLNKTIENNVYKDELVIQIGSRQAPAKDIYIGNVCNTREFVEEYYEDMLVTKCIAYPGMSGGGVFDAYGHLLGMIDAGDAMENGMKDLDGKVETTYSIPNIVLKDLLDDINMK